MLTQERIDLDPYPESAQRREAEQFRVDSRISSRSKVLTGILIALLAIELCAFLGGLASAGTRTLMIVTIISAALAVLGGGILGWRAQKEASVAPKTTCWMIVCTVVWAAIALLALQLTTVAQFYSYEHPESTSAPLWLQAGINAAGIGALPFLLAAITLALVRSVRVPRRIHG